MRRKDRGQLAQSYLVAGNSGTLPALFKFLSERGIEAPGNPDVFIREYKQFTVDEARDVRDRSFARPVVGERRVFILIAPHVTIEAQNALLKTLEEPSADSLFILVVPAPQTLLSTVRSRTHELILAHEKSEETIHVADFLKATPEKRLDMLKPLYTHDEDERDIRGALAFLTRLEESLAKNVENTETRMGLRALYRARKYMTDKGSLLKALLEHVALLTPRM